ncbi:MAG: hypothetical protein CM15mP42_00010 [Methanobacteriota archaeon]|nr:MAG: hypothetical protein CM15mP42_00010 [Euryarchaeota archaeon]
MAASSTFAIGEMTTKTSTDCKNLIANLVQGSHLGNSRTLDSFDGERDCQRQLHAYYAMEDGTSMNFRKYNS